MGWKGSEIPIPISQKLEMPASAPDKFQQLLVEVKDHAKCYLPPRLGSIQLKGRLVA
jgi:hypothetical protein